MHKITVHLLISGEVKNLCVWLKYEPSMHNIAFFSEKSNLVWIRREICIVHNSLILICRWILMSEDNRDGLYTAWKKVCLWLMDYGLIFWLKSNGLKLKWLNGLFVSPNLLQKQKAKAPLICFPHEKKTIIISLVFYIWTILMCVQIHQMPSLQSKVRDLNINANISNFFTRPELLFHSFYNSVLLLYANICLIRDYFYFS